MIQPSDLLELTLRERFGFGGFRIHQREVIAAVLDGQSTLAVMPTGAGKSLCYQLPALLLPGVTVVISPLVALMKDQVDALGPRGIPATFINSTLSERERRERALAMRGGAYKLVYLAPERFRSPRFVEVLQKTPVALFAVDEAHCISQWGHDFRPEYARVGEFRRWLGDPRTLALTATATPEVQRDICRALRFDSPRVFVAGFDRPNLFLEVAPVRTRSERLERAAREAAAGGCGIVYTATRRGAERLAQGLCAKGARALCYHAGLSDAERRAVHELFRREPVVVVATCAFGMGIDRPDVRFVVHAEIPRSIEAYYQEIGRAGRDGQPARALLLFNHADVFAQERLIRLSHPDALLVGDLWDRLRSAPAPSTQGLALALGARELQVQAALRLLEQAGHLERTAAESAVLKLTVLGDPPAEALERAPAQRAALEGIRGLLGRSREGELRLGQLAERAGLELEPAHRAIDALERDGRLATSWSGALSNGKPWLARAVSDVTDPCADRLSRPVEEPGSAHRALVSREPVRVDRPKEDPGRLLGRGSNRQHSWRKDMDSWKLDLGAALRGALGLTAAVALALPGPARACDSEDRDGKFLAGDFHQHSCYTDGSTPFDYEMSRNDMFGLDWWANSEHGGARSRDGDGFFWDDPAHHPAGVILGDVSMSGGHQNMYRWQSLRDFVFPDVLKARAAYPHKRVFSGLEWNVPGHEHSSTGIVAKDGSAISAFEFMFDNGDTDTSRVGESTAYGVLAKQNGKTFPGGSNKSYPDRHADAVAGCAWMQAQYKAGAIDNGWIVFGHVERAGAWSPTAGGGYNVEHFRDFNNAGPDVCFGFEGAPGHQVNPYRGFGNKVTCDAASSTCTSKDFGGTYGGVGFYTAEVGGLWDALLGEGRHWFNFASSDYHGHYTIGGDDFFPGEYQKDWVFAKRSRHGAASLNDIVDGMRSGNSFFVQGDLIDHLGFTVSQGRSKAGMGGTLVVDGHRKIRRPVEITIKLRTPSFNNNGDKPAVDHVDLIAGEIKGLTARGTPEYSNPTNDTAAVIASFAAKDFQADGEGYITITYAVGALTKPMYFRLRGTNLPCGTPNETGPATALPSAEYCKPLPDALVYPNDAQKAYKDLWFYSNPVFVAVK
jgi:RecQ family ATP-dependent DNA helicase